MFGDIVENYQEKVFQVVDEGINRKS